MTVINNIMGLKTIDRTSDPNFPNQSGNLGLTDVPVQTDGDQVFIKRAFLISDAMQVAKDIAGVQSVMTQSAQSFGSAPDNIVQSPVAGLSTSSGASSGGLSPNNVPEPSAALLAIFGALGLGRCGLSRRRG
jgi:hypothetical protein